MKVNARKSLDHLNGRKLRHSPYLQSLYNSEWWESIPVKPAHRRFDRHNGRTGSTGRSTAAFSGPAVARLVGNPVASASPGGGM